MANSFPVTIEEKTRTHTRRYTKKRTRKRADSPESDSESETGSSYQITGTALSRFVLSFLILYAVVAASIFSVFAVQDQAPVLVSDLCQEEINPGEEANFALTVKNPSILEKEFTLALEKDLPSSWIASFCSETQCYYEGCTTSIASLQERAYTVNVITDTTGQTGTVYLVLSYQGKVQERIAFKVKTAQRPEFTAELTDIQRMSEEVAFAVTISNTGNVPDTYTVFVPPGMAARVSEDTVELNPGEHKEITVYIKERKSINTSLMIKSGTGMSETLYLICEQSVHYDFELYSAKEFYIDEAESGISFDIINKGDTPDTYRFRATCLSPGWEVTCSPDQLYVDAKKSERIKVLVSRGEGKNASIIVTATSESGLSKNIKMSIYTQETQGKTVLAEYFTGTWCYVCSYGERALRQLAKETRNLIVLVYHMKDDIETVGSRKRSEGVYGFTDNVSTLVVNGTKHVYYSSGGEGAIYFRYKKIIEELFSDSLKAEVYISGRKVENVAYINAEIHPYVTGTYDVYFVLFKNHFSYRGDTSKMYIVRDVADVKSVHLSQGGVTVSCEFILPADEPEDYGVVVIIQNPETLEVIQANSYML